jgi:hypothetical protein
VARYPRGGGAALPELEVTYPNGQAHRSSVSSSLFDAESLRIGGIA